MGQRPSCSLVVDYPLPPPLPSRLRSLTRRLQRQLTGGRAFTILFTSDECLRRLNRRFRRRNRPTDVLSFPSNDGAEYLGDIAISVPTAQRQAAEHGHDLLSELSILILHGVLHLLGMDHERDHGEMARAERWWRSRLGLPDGLIERACQ